MAYKDPAKQKAYAAAWRAANKTHGVEWNAKNRARRRAINSKYDAAGYMRKRRAADPEFRLLENMRNRLAAAVRGETPKSKRTMTLVGCSIHQLQEHLQDQFTEGMTWDNYGEWHVDHKRPCASFDLTDPAQQRACFHYTNLQPLWAADN